MPTAIELSGTDVSTTALAPISTLFPIVIFPRIFAPAPMLTLFPKDGAAFSEIFFNPTVTPLRIMQLSPKLAYPLMMISPKWSIRKFLPTGTSQGSSMPVSI